MKIEFLKDLTIITCFTTGVVGFCVWGVVGFCVCVVVVSKIPIKGNLTGLLQLKIKETGAYLVFVILFSTSHSLRVKGV